VLFQFANRDRHCVSSSTRRVALSASSVVPSSVPWSPL
jgi:hypothetical protein